jgi:osmotically-inducible protein OsmY
MRVIKVNEDSRRDRWILWMLAGTALGVTAGVLAAEKFSGRNPSAKGLLRRARTLAKTARDQWGPMLTLALELRDAFGSRSTLGARYDEDELEDEAYDVYEDADEYEEAEPPGRGQSRAAELDDDLDEALDEKDLDESDEETDEETDEDFDDEEELDSVDDPLIGRRVLEAFENDPILAERNVEIDADDEAGTVTLFGSVRSPKEVAHAVTLARGVPGVTKVRQQLEIVRRRR